MNEGSLRLCRELVRRRLGEHLGGVPGRRFWIKVSPERAAEVKRRALAGESPRARTSGTKCSANSSGSRYFPRKTCSLPHSS